MRSGDKAASSSATPHATKAGRSVHAAKAMIDGVAVVRGCGEALDEGVSLRLSLLATHVQEKPDGKWVAVGEGEKVVVVVGLNGRVSEITVGR